jgi:hypothetical protein
MTVGGPARYLLGESMFRLRMNGSVNPKRLTAVVALCVLGLGAGALFALALAGAVGVLLTALAVWEYAPSLARAQPPAPKG